MFSPALKTVLIQVRIGEPYTDTSISAMVQYQLILQANRYIGQAQIYILYIYYGSPIYTNIKTVLYSGGNA